MKSYICYLDDNDEKISGYFEIVEQKDNYVKIKSGTNFITLPRDRVIKVKEKVK